MKTLRTATVLVLGLAALAAHGQNLLVNGNFETDAYPANGYSAISSLSGWAINPVGNVAGIGAGYLGQTTQEIDLSGISDLAGSGISQSFATTAGKTYLLDLDVFTGNSASGVNVAVGGTRLASALTGSSLTHYNYVFTATGPSTTLSLASSGGNVSQVDNVKVQAVPEPGAFAALAIGAAGLFRRRRA